MDTQPMSRRVKTRIRIGGILANGFFKGASRLGQMLPISNPDKYGVTRTSNIPYLDTDDVAHKLDVYRSKDAKGLQPIILYIHGGGFRLCSKDTHWLPGIKFARAGYTVFNINYGLVPTYRYPEPLQHCAAALEWIVNNAESYGGDVSRIAFAGESAGANLCLALAICTTYKRPEPFAKMLYDLKVVPSAVFPAAGILQVSDPERFHRDQGVHWFYGDRVTSVCKGYLSEAAYEPLSLADPLLILESTTKPDRALPALFSITSAGDPIVNDTYRLQAAIESKGGSCEIISYENEIHAFHLFYFKPNAKEAWKRMLAFSQRVLPTSEEGP
jgi:acetyl esterase